MKSKKTLAIVTSSLLLVSIFSSSVNANNRLVNTSPYPTIITEEGEMENQEIVFQNQDLDTSNFDFENIENIENEQETEQETEIQNQNLNTTDSESKNDDEIKIEGNETFIRHSLETGETKKFEFQTEKTSRSFFNEGSTPAFIPNDKNIDVNILPPTVAEEIPTGRAIIDSDTRSQITNVTVYPFSAICHLEVTWSDGTISGATGTMIAPGALLTAGHVIL